MIHFECDYNEGAHENVLRRLSQTNAEQTSGYGEDGYCAQAAEKIRSLCEAPNAQAHFLVGGTQANATVIDAALRPHQGVLSAHTGHIAVHETGAVEACGHKVLTLPGADGKITAAQIAAAVDEHWADPSFEHIVQPGMVYLSHPTELGTLYSLAELQEISRVCREKCLFLFVDGARLAYGLAARGADVTLPELAKRCDVFTFGGTKAGALFGEAVVITNPAIAKDFRYLIKRHGGMLAKGRLLGLQFLALLENDLYLSLGNHAIAQAGRIRDAFAAVGIPLAFDSPANLLFPILTKAQADYLQTKYAFYLIDPLDNNRYISRFCTSWATRPEDVEQLTNDIRKL
ncbi:MAG: aminotransferase class I/II-fold pyridoxal phosphate-dependent enzyme [Clostridiales bacterium]|nr:aminotransferase class I/II-fold pyridoxal phosphate-dependent enzyme [Clostridiales bacterium]